VSLIVLAPEVVIALLEVVLVITGAVKPTGPLQRVHHLGREYMTANPRFGERFFTRDGIPALSPLFVPVESSNDVMRIVLLGESAAQGFPAPEFNLSRMVEAVWQLRHPDQPIEVINLTMVGINSHVLRLLAEEAMVFKPHAMVLYAGHNEVIGPFGPASVFGRYRASTLLIRFSIWLRSLRISYAIEQAGIWKMRLLGRHLQPWEGLNAFVDSKIAEDDPRLTSMRGHFDWNLRDMVRIALKHDAGVILGVPAVNLTDWPPLGSEDAEGNDEVAMLMVKQGGLGQLHSALQAYRLARRMKNEEDGQHASELYQRACDLDVYRFRADRGIRDAIRNLAETMGHDRVLLADVDFDFQHNDAADHEYFLEHVHLTFRGRVKAALVIVKSLEQLVGTKSQVSFEESEAALERAVAEKVFYTDWDELDIWQSVRVLLSGPVFRNQFEIEERIKSVEAVIAELSRSAASNWPLEKLTRLYHQESALQPHDPILHVTAGRQFMTLGRLDMAEMAIQRALAINPYYTEAYLNLARIYMTVGKYPEAASVLDALERIRPSQVELPGTKGELLARMGDFNLALPYLKRAVVLRPSDASSLANLAMVYEQLHESQEAESIYRKGIEVSPQNGQMLNNLAWLLATGPEGNRNRWDEAIDFARRAVELEPAQYRYRGTLAVALAASGRNDEATKIARQVIAEAKAIGDQAAITELKTRILNTQP